MTRDPYLSPVAVAFHVLLVFFFLVLPGGNGRLDLLKILLDAGDTTGKVAERGGQ